MRTPLKQNTKRQPFRLVASSFVLAYTVSLGTLGKGFSGYVSTFLGIDHESLIIRLDHTDDVVIDVLGASFIIILTLLLASGVRASFVVNGVTTGMSITVIVFIIVAAIPNLDVQNYTPFFPEDVKVTKVCHGVSFLYYAYSGYDSLASVAEDARNPSRNLPMAIIVCLVVCIVLYSVLAAALIGIVP